MTWIEHNLIVVDEPNWRPLEMVLTRGECEDFMYIGRAGQIQLYKHAVTRRYLNISPDGPRFYRHERDEYVEVSEAEALAYVRH